MKLIVAYLSPQPLQKLINALADQHVHGLTVSEARGFGQEHDVAHPEYRDFNGLELTRKLRLEIACHDEEVSPIVQAIYSTAHTGQRGDGKVFVLPIDEVVRIRTGDRGPEAI